MLIEQSDFLKNKLYGLDFLLHMLIESNEHFKTECFQFVKLTDHGIL